MEPVRRPWHYPWPPRRLAEIGLLAFVTVFCWGLWIHLLLPLVGLVLWWLGIERLFEEVLIVGYADLSQTLLSYTGVFLVMVSLFGLWVLWNVFCYGGSVRADDKLPRVARSEVRQVFDLSHTDLATLRGARVVHVDLDPDDRVRVAALPLPAADEQALGGTAG